MTGLVSAVLWWQTQSYLSDLMRLRLSEEHSFHQTHKPSVTSQSQGPQWADLWNSWLILNGNKGFGSINLSTKSKVYSTRSCSFFWQPRTSHSKLPSFNHLQRRTIKMFLAGRLLVVSISEFDVENYGQREYNCMGRFLILSCKLLQKPVPLPRLTFQPILAI